MMTNLQTSVAAKANIPQVITKELAVLNKQNGRNIVLSTNFLPLMGFNAGVRHAVKPIAGLNGLEVEFDTNGKQKIYERKYASRRNNPFETQIHIQNQSVIDLGIPSYTERIHFEMRHGKIVIRPLANQTFHIRKNLLPRNDVLNSFVAMTGGVDVRCLIDCGYVIDTVAEFRPVEKRDNLDLTETGVLSVLANAAPRVVFNEDISKMDMKMVERIMADAPPISFFHISLQCDEFSNLKSRGLKQASVDDLSTSADLVYDGLRLIETVRPAVILLEQVPNFSDSPEGNLFTTKLRKWGYHVSQKVCDAREYGGHTSRKRYYVVASVWPNFEMPAESLKSDKETVWSVVERHLHNCRDVSHTNSVHEGIKTGRIRILNKDSKFCPTITKSQDRQAKDSVYIEHEGRFLFPSLELLSEMNGIPADFNFNSVSRSIQSELIGQSIEYPLHEKIVMQVKNHIYENVGNFSLVNIKKEK